MISPGIYYDWWCLEHAVEFKITSLTSKGGGGPIHVCPECVRVARDRVKTEINRWMKTHGYRGGWSTFEGWH